MSSHLTAVRQLNIVAVCYHLTPATFLARLQGLVEPMGIVLRGLLISNNSAHALAVPSAGPQVVRGSNRQLDFSGYFEGLEQLLRQSPEASSQNVLFVNDSLFTKHAAGCVLRRVITLDALLRQLRVPAIAGKLDPYRLICLRNPWNGHTGYVSSYCFLLNADALPLLSRLPVDASDAGVFAPVPIHDDAWGLGVPKLLREQIRAHLDYRGSPFLWPMVEKADAELIGKKASCVYFEHRLSGAIGTDGALVPINMGPRSKLAIYLSEAGSRIWRTLSGSR